MIKRQRHSGAAIATAICIVPLMAVSGGLVLATIWNWFIARQFNTISLTIAQATGMLLMVRFVIDPTVSGKNSDEIFISVEAVLSQTVTKLGLLLLTLVTAYIIKLFL